MPTIKTRDAQDALVRGYIELREATTADAEFIYRVVETTMRSAGDAAG